MNLVRLLLDRAAHHPERAAIIAPARDGTSESCTFADLVTRTTRTAAALRAAGVRDGAHVLMGLRLGIDFYAALLGTWYAGGAAVVVDPSLTRRRLRGALRRAAPRHLVTDGTVGCLARLLPELWRTRAIDCRSLTDAAPPDVAPRAADDPALITFTSGSTGAPKAVVRTHGVLSAQHDALAAVLATPDDVVLTTLPIFVLTQLASGATSVIADADLRAPGAIDPAPVARQITAHGVRSVIAAPAFLERLTTAPAPPRFERVFTGGAPLFPDLDARCRPLATDAFTVLYGSSEAEPIAELTTMTASDHAAIRAGAGLPAGHSIDAIDVRIIRDPLDAAPSASSIDALTVADGAAGEIVVRGAHVVPHYLDGAGEAETKLHLDDGTWHRTGDAGRRAADGRLWLLGRCEAGVARGTPDALYPFQVEAAVRAAHPVPCALLARRGRRAALFVAASSTTTLDAIAAIVEPIASVEIIPLPALPLDRRHHGKIDYAALRRYT